MNQWFKSWLIALLPLMMEAFCIFSSEPDFLRSSNWQHCSWIQKITICLWDHCWNIQTSVSFPEHLNVNSFDMSVTDHIMAIRIPDQSTTRSLSQVLFWFCCLPTSFIRNADPGLICAYVLVMMRLVILFCFTTMTDKKLLWVSIVRKVLPNRWQDWGGILFGGCFFVGFAGC